jgi:hypothetical protein
MDGGVGDEEVLERVREDEQDPSFLVHLEQPDPEEPVVPEEAGDVDRSRVGPVAVDGQERDRQIEDVEGLVVVLIAVEVQVGELLEDRLIGGVEDEGREDRGERESRDEERDDESQPHHHEKHCDV